MTFRIQAFMAGGLIVSLAWLAPAVGALADDQPHSEATWDMIRPAVFQDRAIDGEPIVDLGAPTRAEDAALVPIDIHIKVPQGDQRSVKTLTLVVDENPSPQVATFTFGPDRKAFDLSTRVRVNSYSYVRAIAETSDGKLHMTKAFVKAAGGCSAPAVKDPAEAKADLGKMRFRIFTNTGKVEAQLQIRHPNYSGMQMDQISHLYTPAWFVQTLSIVQGNVLLFAMEGGISMSEDPTFRFSYAPNDQPIHVTAKDTEGNVFEQDFTGSDGG